jgi:hypothetical protein
VSDYEQYGDEAHLSDGDFAWEDATLAEAGIEGESDAETPDIDLDSLSETELVILAGFYEAAGGDPEQASEMFNTYMERLEGRAGERDEEEQATGPTEDELTSWLSDHPAVAADIEGFMPFYRHTLDLEAANELYSANLDVLAGAAEKEGYHPGGKKLSMADAIDAAYHDGDLGGRRPEAFVRKPSDSDMDAAYGEFFSDLSMKGAVEKQARSRIRAIRRAG